MYCNTSMMLRQPTYFSLLLVSLNDFVILVCDIVYGMSIIM